MTNKRMWVPILLIAILLGSAIYLLRGNHGEKMPTDNSSNSQQKGPSFTISPVTPLQFACHTRKLPEQTTGIRVAPQGQFCSIRVRAEHVSHERQDLKGDGTYLIGSDGKKYAPDLYTMSFVNNSWSAIEPRTPTEATFIFDIPRKVKPLSVELRDRPEQSANLVDIPQSP